MTDKQALGMIETRGLVGAIEAASKRYGAWKNRERKNLSGHGFFRQI